MRTRAIALCLAMSAGMLVQPASAQYANQDAGQDAGARSAEQIIAQLDALEAPKYEAARRDEEGYMDSFYAQRREYLQAQAALTGELYRADPANERLIRLMPMRWNVIGGTDPDAALAEMDEVMQREGDLAVEAAYASAGLIGRTSDYDKSAFMPALERFRTIAPKDDRAVRLMMSAAGSGKLTDEESVAMYKLAMTEYPESGSIKYIPGKIRQVEMIGKPFEFEFKDATTGATVSSKELRGKVLVVDFWATWCPPCVAEMPHMKEVYAQYKDKGVEFIGISLDNPESDDPAKCGLTKLRAYCDENDIAWPQHFQGDGWKSEFSTAWGINGIPTMFIIDRKGNLHSVEARGKLETMIPELLGLTERGAG